MPASNFRNLTLTSEALVVTGSTDAGASPIQITAVVSKQGGPTRGGTVSVDAELPWKVEIDGAGFKTGDQVVAIGTEIGVRPDDKVVGRKPAFAVFSWQDEFTLD